MGHHGLRHDLPALGTSPKVMLLLVVVFLSLIGPIRGTGHHTIGLRVIDPQPTIPNRTTEQTATTTRIHHRWISILVHAVIGSIIMQTTPNFGKKRLLTSELHLGPLFVVSLPHRFQLLPHLLGTFATSNHVVVQDVEGLGGIRQSLDGGWEKTAGTVAAKAVTTGETGESGGEALAFPEAVGFGEDAGLHLGQEKEGEGCGGVFVGGDDQGGCVGGGSVGVCVIVVNLLGIRRVVVLIVVVG
mmetsp:Transcript_13885/g.26499  ORF Transcript_13885/g.26499 Transcript_13885/m.26499 type:complete len:243 (+) Transcript_13885:613-1341(+)